MLHSHSIRRIPIMLCLVASVAIPASAQFSSTPGFGTPFTRKRVELRRKLPPVANITGKSVAVTVEAQGALKAELQGTLENLLTRSDSSVQVGGAHPDYVIACTVTTYAAPKLVTTKEGNVTSQNYTGALNVAFRIAEPGNGRVVRSGVATTELDQPASAASSRTGGLHISIPGILQPASTGPKLSSTMDTENALVSDVARQIASYVVNTDENISVLLASGGALNNADKLAQSNLWSRNLEDLEVMTPFADPKLDTYRLYNIGVANEALAYQSQDAKAAIKYLQAASVDYGKALSARPDEKFFLDPQNRIKSALMHYDAPAAAVLHPPPPTAAEPSGAVRGMSNEDVVAMVQAKMDQANILDNIQTSPRVSFDLSVDGQVQLLKKGVNNQILAAMKQKARGANATAGH